MQMPLWRAALLRCPAACPCASGRGPSSSALFHSTPVVAAKWKAKFDYDKDERKNQRPSKNYGRYIVRQKRSDAKRVLNEFLLKGGYKPNVQAEWMSWYVGTSKSSRAEETPFSANVHAQPFHPGSGKTQKQRTRKAKQTGKRRKRWDFVSDDEQYTETTFETAFGDKHYTWSFKSPNEEDPQSSRTGFKWRDYSNWSGDTQGTYGNRKHSTYGNRKHTSYQTNNKRGWDCESDIDDEEEEDDFSVRRSSMHSCSYRVVLGLPPTGLLKLDDVKTAFRASALKWHPDKHQGPSQDAAVEKFRLCVDAYNYLCGALNAA